MADTTSPACNLSPIDGTCYTHPGVDCSTLPLRPMPVHVTRPQTTQLHHLAIFQWAWSEDARVLGS